ncbi:uncharacterized protein LOC143537952 [Bidens hawaiensis]|uniref:uncharacterized protein LOC143537952 n=1 Tax=Bidens hawaiensis TaxID=980011 RepID=UPI00404A19A9
MKDEINPSSLKTFTTIAYRCLNLKREARPRMTEVVSTLETALYYQESIQSPPIPLRDISPGDAAGPIEVRVVRRWIPPETEIECWYLFVDRNRDAIQVVADLRDVEHFNAIITLQSCYRVTNYICESCRYIGKVVPHCAIIRIGKAATFLQILDDGFPSHYFNFVTYENLRARLNKRQLLTDYVGKVEIESITDSLIQSDKNCLKIKLLQDPSGEVIEATLSGEVATLFDKDALMHSTVIAALTSMKVVENEGALQLTSTSATHIYVDPNIEQAKAIAAKFQGENTAIERSMSGNKDNESERNRATLAELLEKIPKHHTGTRFTCIASITKINKRRSWYYKGCTECLKKLKPRGDIMACADHGDILKPRYMYCVNVTITDDTKSASAIFFDEAMTSLLQTECINMVVDQGYKDPNIIPEPLHSMIRQTRIFQLELAIPIFKSSARFIINQVFQTTLPTTITLSTAPALSPSTPSSKSTRVKRKLPRSQDTDDDTAKLKKEKPKKSTRIVKRLKTL